MWGYRSKYIDIIFVICIIIIIALSIYIYLSSTNFYNSLDETMRNNVNLNIQVMQEEQMNYIHDILEEKLEDRLKYE